MLFPKYERRIINWFSNWSCCCSSCACALWLSAIKRSLPSAQRSCNLFTGVRHSDRTRGLFWDRVFLRTASVGSMRTTSSATGVGSELADACRTLASLGTVARHEARSTKQEKMILQLNVLHALCCCTLMYAMCAPPPHFWERLQHYRQVYFDTNANKALGCDEGVIAALWGMGGWHD